MKIKEHSKIALKNLRSKKLRSWLTIIGIILSIATIFTLISLSIGLNDAIKEQFRQLGTDKFFIQPKGQLGAPGTSGAVTLTSKDAEIIKKISGVKEVAINVVANVKVQYKEKAKYVMAIGLDPDGMELFFESGFYNLDEGRLLTEHDSKKIILGSQYKYNDFLEHQIRQGDKILINEYEFYVKGILESVGNPQDDRNIYLIEDDLRTFFNVSERIDALIVQVEEGRNVKEVADTTKRKLMKYRDVDEKTIDFTILTPEELLESFSTILVILTSFLSGIAAISLLVGAIGIANTMYTSVLERTREIGIMKSIGAKNQDILSIFLIESGFLGLVGGIFGILIGIAISKATEYIALSQLSTTLLHASLSPYLISGCLIFSFLIGAISGTLPAWQAARTSPVNALRYE